MNQSVMMSTAAKTQNSLTGRILTTNQTIPSRMRSDIEVILIAVPTLLSAKPILVGTEYVKGTENTALVCDVSSEASARLTSVDMFSAPTTVITNGKIYVGSVVGSIDTPHPFQPRSAKMLNDMTDEQHN